MTFSDPCSPISAARALQNHSLFWMPDYLTESAGVAQLPLVFWLVDALRPNVVVSLGGHEGVVHLGICQAVQKLALDCTCYFHLAQPAGETFMRRCQDSYRECSRPLAALKDVPDGAVDLACVNVTDVARGEEIDWEKLHRKLSSCGVLLIYGAAVDVPHHPLPAAAVALLSGGSRLQLGGGADAAVLLFAATPPAGVAALAALGEVDADPAGAAAVTALLRNQGRLLELERHRRALPILAPDPTAPELPEPQTLEEAKAQMAQLVELHASDLEQFGAQLEGHGEDIAALKAAHQKELADAKAELARKDMMLETLNQRLGERYNAEVGGQNRSFEGGYLSRLYRAFRMSR
ncbi:hypothetical protein KUV57_22485 [Epibacterium sp. DP7N7-1]|nr:hypothetical protein [Epibacterium sp. DP7N7-1]